MSSRTVSSSLVMLQQQDQQQGTELTSSVNISVRPEHANGEPAAAGAEGRAPLVGPSGWAGVVPLGQGGDHGARAAEEPCRNLVRAP